MPELPDFYPGGVVGGECGSEVGVGLVLKCHEFDGDACVAQALGGELRVTPLAGEDNDATARGKICR